MSETPGKPPGPPKRVRVTSPWMGAPHRAAARPPAPGLDEQNRMDELFMTSLIRAQWRLSVSVLASTAVMIGGLPLLFLLVPATGRILVGPVPLPWLILGVLVYPALWLAGRYYVSQSEQIEREFTELVARR